MQSAKRFQSISRKHATIDLDQDGLCTITDHGSLNGTKRNDEPLKPNRPYELRPGDTVQLGEELNGIYSVCSVSQAKNHGSVDCSDTTDTRVRIDFIFYIYFCCPHFIQLLKLLNLII